MKKKKGRPATWVNPVREDRVLREESWLLLIIAKGGKNRHAIERGNWRGSESVGHIQAGDPFKREERSPSLQGRVPENTLSSKSKAPEAQLPS